MRAVIVSIGSELIEGHLTDSNATFLAQEMAALGIELVGVFQVGDDLQRLILTLQRGWDDADLIVTTGGIGPTDDDLTREAIAEMLGEQVEIDLDLRATIEAFFQSRGMTMPERNAKQAWVIPSCEPLLNPMGTAPGWFVRREHQAIVSMPGVPREMFRMWREQAVPRLAPFLGDQVIVSRTIKTIGIGESAAEQMITDIIRRDGAIVATYAKDDGVHIRITASAATEAEAAALVDQAEADVQEILGEFIYGPLELRLGAAILAPLVASGKTLAIAEAGGAGRTTALLSEEPAATIHLRGGIIRAFEQSADEQNVDVSEPSAPQRLALLEADAVRSNLQGDVGLAIVVRLVPGPTLDKTQGEIALCITGMGEPRERQHQVTAVPPEIRRRAALWTIEFLRNSLIDGLSGGD